jgi:sugar phosphate isomerase/epimerase
LSDKGKIFGGERMKMSCLPVSLFSDITDGKLQLGDWIDLAADSGLDGADISIMFIKNHTDTYLRQFKKMQAEKSIPIVMCTAYPDFTHYDAMQLRREMEYLRRDIALCSELRIPYLRVLAGQAHPETPVDRGVAQAIENLRKSAQVADEYGVSLVYENHGKPGSWQYIDLTYPPDLFLKVFAGIRDTSIRVNFDIGNVTAFGADSVELLEKVFDKVETIHVSDMAEKGKFSPVAIGAGVAPIKESFSLLKKRGFDKWISIEEASFKGAQGIRDAVKTTRRLWSEA